MRYKTLLLLFLISLPVFFQTLNTFADVQESQGPPNHEVLLAIPNTEASGLVILADTREFFNSEELKVSLERYENATQSLAAVLSGHADLGVVEQTAIVTESFERRDFVILGTVYTSPNHIKIIARKDKNIAGPSDLKAAKIGAERWSAEHFFLSSLLINHGLTLRNVVFKHMEFSEIIPKLEKGEIDAAVLREPFVTQASESLGSNSLIISHKDLYISTYNLVALSEYVKANPQKIRKVLKALSQAENFIRHHPEEAIAMLAKDLSLAPPYLSKTIQESRLALSLDQNLLLMMELVAKWMFQDGMAVKRSSPNYLRYLDWEALEEINPEALGVIH